jgi:hypothetical protein
VRVGRCNSCKDENCGGRNGACAQVLNSLLSLELALECDGWVGAHYSHWNRLIDELRSTVRCKAHGVYLDASAPDFRVDVVKWNDWGR